MITLYQRFLMNKIKNNKKNTFNYFFFKYITGLFSKIFVRTLRFSIYRQSGYEEYACIYLASQSLNLLENQLLSFPQLPCFSISDPLRKSTSQLPSASLLLSFPASQLPCFSASLLLSFPASQLSCYSTSLLLLLSSLFFFCLSIIVFYHSLTFKFFLVKLIIVLS